MVFFVVVVVVIIYYSIEVTSSDLDPRVRGCPSSQLLGLGRCARTVRNR
jgi:hypothetical protein